MTRGVPPVSVQPRFAVLGVIGETRPDPVLAPELYEASLLRAVPVQCRFQYRRVLPCLVVVVALGDIGDLFGPALDDLQTCLVMHLVN